MTASSIAILLSPPQPPRLAEHHVRADLRRSLSLPRGAGADRIRALRVEAASAARDAGPHLVVERVRIGLAASVGLFWGENFGRKLARLTH